MREAGDKSKGLDWMVGWGGWWKHDSAGSLWPCPLSTGLCASRSDAAHRMRAARCAGLFARDVIVPPATGEVRSRSLWCPRYPAPRGRTATASRGQRMGVTR